MKKLNKTLLAGPWVGEFGWELFAWQAYVRALSRHYKETIVVCRESSKPLYQDFASDFIHINVDGVADSFFMYGINTDDLLRKTLIKNSETIRKELVVFKPRRIGNPPNTMYNQSFSFGSHQITPEYLIYGQQGKPIYDYVFHIRSRELRKQDNWHIDKWKRLLNLLPDNSKVACIGTKSESGHISGTDDLRGENLQNVFNVLRNAKCCFGPSSGPMHLASLCGCPHVVWSTPKNFERYTRTWNPLKTRVLFDSDNSWHPEPESIYKKYLRWINE